VGAADIGGHNLGWQGSSSAARWYSVGRLVVLAGLKIQDLGIHAVLEACTVVPVDVRNHYGNTWMAIFCFCFSACPARFEQWGWHCLQAARWLCPWRMLLTFGSFARGCNFLFAGYCWMQHSTLLMQLRCYLHCQQLAVLGSHSSNLSSTVYVDLASCLNVSCLVSSTIHTSSRWRCCNGFSFEN
jgi:hypothetical protein